MTAKPPFWATIFTILSLVILCSLGTWQMQRLHWKQNLLQELVDARASTPDTLDIATITATTFDDDLVKYVTVTGHFIKNSGIFIGPRTWQGQNGYHHVAILASTKNDRLIINRGWIPAGKKTDVNLPDGAVTITGLLRHPDPGNFFTPANDPAAGHWFSINPRQIAAFQKLDNVVPTILYAEQESGTEDLPVQDALRWEPPNNHFGYAVFWYSMAVILMLIYWLRFIVRQRETHISPDR